MGAVIGSEPAECCAHNLEMCVYKLRIPSEMFRGGVIGSKE